MSPLPPKPQSPEKKPNVLLIICIILAIALVGLIGFVVYEKVGAKGTASPKMAVLSSDQASKDLVDFINEVYGPRIGPVTLKSVSDENGLYKVVLTVTENGAPSDQEVYVTKDGKIFVPQAIDIATMKEQFKTYQAQQEAAPADSAATGAAPAEVPAEEPAAPAN